MEIESRLTVSVIGDDPRSSALCIDAEVLGIPLATVEIADVVHIRGALSEADATRLTELLVDPLLQRGTWHQPAQLSEGLVIETALHPGVTDTAAAEVVRAASMLGIVLEGAAIGRRYVLHGVDADQSTDQLVRRLLANPVVERWTIGGAITTPFPDATAAIPAPEVVPLRDLDETGLADLNRARGMALDPEELLVVQQHFRDEGREPIDVELETIAQTWSEHCAHKTFRATVVYPDGREGVPLLNRLREVTDQLDAPFVVSSFVGNAGIVSYTPGRTYALKMETHNHPSAVEPFGGANTGVGGVIRDVIGAAHHPIAVTDVLCFGHPDLDPALLPEGVLHPRRIRDGVVAGVADYGNKMGLPTVAGGVLYDNGYAANPLVFCGCIGVADNAPTLTGPHPGDRIIVLGGRTGRDGIRGATFSSMTMDATTGQVAGASVQIGDPIVEKRVMDALRESHGLYTAITDCGAGGLSSAVGEMAEVTGALVDLDAVPLKYSGLAAWEIWLSEAQERMVLSVAADGVAAIAAVCDRWGVEWCDIGEFTGTGRLVVRHQDSTVLDLDTTFLHDGRPRRRLAAEMPTPDRTDAAAGPPELNSQQIATTVLALLADRNVASKADIIHRYDHEIRGATVGRPLVGPGLDGPGDGSALVDPTDGAGIAIGIGMNPWFGIDDPEYMAWAAVDEAIRNLVAVGADPTRVALMDNFSWGDPRRPSTFGALTAAVDGCCAAALAYGAPFVSGKDSLNNEYTGIDGQRHSVPPTLVITATAPVSAADVISSALTKVGNVLVLVGTTKAERGMAHPGPVPAPDPKAPARYVSLNAAIQAELVESCHDVSDGGLAVTIAEMCIAGNLGAELQSVGHPSLVTGLFSESVGRLVCEVSPFNLDLFVSTIGTHDVTVIGIVTSRQVMRLLTADPIPLDTLRSAFNSTTGTPP